MTTERATSWSITINNPSANDEEAIALARQRGWAIDGQLEKGENGTLHYQLIAKTPQVRFSAVKKLFPRAHIEVARNVKALSQYVKKDDTRVSQLETQSEMYPSLQKTWDMFADYIETMCDQKSYPVWADYQQDDWLRSFDKFIAHIIEKGYCVETLAVNPQTRSCIKLFGPNIFKRSVDRRQTVRQDGTDLDNTMDITSTTTNGISETTQSDEEEGNSTESISTDEENCDSSSEARDS